MPITHFERIQICCEDVYESASLFGKLLGQNPYWSGQYRLLGEGERVCDHGAAARFDLNNTAIELYSSAQRNMQPGIAGVILGCDTDVPLPLNDGEFETYRCIYSDAEGDCFDEPQFILKDQAHEGFLITLIQAPWQYPRAGNRGDIESVDHLVLHSHDAEATIQRFGESGLGLRLALDQDAPHWGGRMLFFRCGKLTLEVIVPAKGLQRPDYFWGVAYQSGDLELTHKRLSQSEVEISEVREGRKPGTRVCSLKSHTSGVPSLLLETVAKA